MSALEMFTVSPAATRPVLRALKADEPVREEFQGGFEPLVRLAHRLLPGALLLLYRENHDPALLTWPRGIMGRRESIEPLAQALCAASVGSQELRVASLLGHSRFATIPEVQEAGPFAFAAVGLPDHAPGGLLGVLREEGVWTDDESELLRDLSSAFAAESVRQSLLRRVDELKKHGADVQDRYRQLLATSSKAELVLERSGRISGLTDAACVIIGRPASELIGLHVRRLFAHADMRPGLTVLREVLGGASPTGDVVIQVTRPTGEKRVVLLVIEAILAGSEIQGVRAVARDITEERIRETQLRLAERVTTVAPLLSGVCHELNNPLTSIKSFAELLLLDTRSPDDKEALEIVQREAHRAARIVSDLRMVARQSQEASMQREPVGIDDVVRRVVQTRGPELSAARVEVRVEHGMGLPRTLAVRSHIEQVVSQLISNAVNAMSGGEGPRVLTIATYRSDHGVSFAVRDTGRGIAPDHLGRIFDPFWTGRREGDGTGLGLSLAYSIVANHGGRIVADSQLGRGTAITVDLALADEAPPEVETGEDRSASRPLRVLVVDDEAPIRFSVARYLERRGHEVHQAADGNAALQLVNAATPESRYDIIIADLRMPGLSGENLLASLRERSDGLEHKLIFMTGDPQSPGATRLLQESGIPVMWKPFELAEVAQVIEAQARLLGV